MLAGLLVFNSRGSPPGGTETCYGRAMTRTLPASVVLLSALACSGVVDEQPLQRAVAAPATERPATVDHRVSAFVPREPSPARIEPFVFNRGVDHQTLHYDVTAAAVREAFERDAVSDGASVRPIDDDLVRLDFEVERLEVSLTRVAVTSEGEGSAATVHVRRELTAGWWPEDPRCGEGRIRAEGPADGGGTVSACFDLGGSGYPDGQLQIERGGVVVVDGTYASGARDGRWRIRGDAGELRAVGSFAEKVPAGTWRFGSDEIAFEGGDPVGEVSWVELRGDPRLSTASEVWTHEVLDADLAGGWVALRQRYTYAVGDTSAEACGYPGMTDPKEGVRLALVRPGSRQSVGVWEVYASVARGHPCTTAEDAGEELASAKAALAARGLDPAARPALVMPVDGSFTIGGRRLEIREAGYAIPLEEALSTPDLLRGDWGSDPEGMRVEVLEVTLDGEPVQRVAVRSDRSCAGRHQVSATAAIHQGDRVALLWEGSHGSCSAEVPFVLVGPVWAL